jgi:hypothetical protein
VDWEKAETLDVAAADLEKRPEEAARFAMLPSAASNTKNYTAWTRDIATWLYGSQVLNLLYSPSQKVYSKVGETERDFRIRLGQGAREQRDEAVAALRQKYAPKIAALQERLRKSEQTAARQKEQARQAGLQTAISVGATLLGAFTGRKITSASTIGRATSAARGFGRSINESQDVGRAEDTVEVLQKQLNDFSAEFNAESATLMAKIDPTTEVLDTVTIKPKKADITVQLLVLAWAPYWQDAKGTVSAAW